MTWSRYCWKWKQSTWQTKLFKILRNQKKSYKLSQTSIWFILTFLRWFWLNFKTSKMRRSKRSFLTSRSCTRSWPKLFQTLTRQRTTKPRKLWSKVCYQLNWTRRWRPRMCFTSGTTSNTVSCTKSSWKLWKMRTMDSLLLLSLSRRSWRSWRLNRAPASTLESTLESLIKKCKSLMAR